MPAVYFWGIPLLIEASFIISWSCQEIRRHFVGLQATVDEWLCARYQADMKAVTALVAHVGQAVEKAQRLPHPLRLTGLVHHPCLKATIEKAHRLVHPLRLTSRILW